MESETTTIKQRSLLARAWNKIVTGFIVAIPLVVTVFILIFLFKLISAISTPWLTVACQIPPLSDSLEARAPSISRAK